MELNLSLDFAFLPYNACSSPRIISSIYLGAKTFTCASFAQNLFRIDVTGVTKVSGEFKFEMSLK